MVDTEFKKLVKSLRVVNSDTIQETGRNSNTLLIQGSYEELIDMFNENLFKVCIVSFIKPQKDDIDIEELWKSSYDYADKCVSTIKRLFNLVGNNGLMFILSEPVYMPYIEMYMYDRYNIVDRVIWEYKEEKSCNLYNSAYTPILIVNRGEEIENKDDSAIERSTAGSTLVGGFASRIRNRSNSQTDRKDINGNVWYTEKENGGIPIGLFDKIIKSVTNKGDMILYLNCGYNGSVSSYRNDRYSVSIDRGDSIDRVRSVLNIKK